MGKDPVNTEAQRQNSLVPHVLVAEDDAPLGNFIRRQLESESYNVNLVQDGELAAEALTQDKYHLLVLDLNMPKMDGVAVLNRVRPKQPQLPILVLTARNQVEDRVLSLDSGADDCLLKPFSFAELLARVRALLRRNPYLPGSPLQIGDLILDSREYRVERAGKRINLSGKEFALLEYLMRNAHQTVTRAMIMEHVWNMPFDNSTNLVDVYVKYVRDKVDNAEFSTQMIRTVRGVGYVFSDN
jgi:two-component system, OmpR family, copper resistance phosphate regulon response regulator CusR